MKQFTINKNGNLQYDIEDNLRISNIRGLYEKQISEDEVIIGIIPEMRFDMILCERIKLDNENKSDQDFYDENDEADELEKEMIEPYENLKNFLLVVVGIGLAMAFINTVNYLINLF